MIEPLSGLLIPRPEYSVNWGATLKAIKMLILLQISDGVGLLDLFRDHGNDEKSVTPEFGLYSTHIEWLSGFFEPLSGLF